MNRRQAIAAAGGGLLALAVPETAADAGRRAWFPVARAGAPSCNGNVYPAAVLAAAARVLGPCPVRRSVADESAVVGRVYGWRFARGWLWADAEVRGDPAGELLTACWYAEFAPAGGRRRVAGVRQAAHLYFVPAAETSWPDRPPPDGGA